MANRQLVGCVESGKVTDIGRRRSIVERTVCRVGDECWRVGRDTRVPSGAVVEVLGVGVVGPELQTTRWVVAKIELESAL